ncbi:MAG: hypothetical protein AB8B55_14870 [Mariniblastus sp.]
MNNLDSPYRSPQFDGSPNLNIGDAPDGPVNSLRVILKWTAICFVSAAPSFVLGLMMDGANPPAIVGMVTGILTFVFMYSIVEHLPAIQRFLKDMRFAQTAKIGYGTRIGVSIVFPVGIYLDLLVGIFTTTFGLAIINLLGVAHPERNSENELGDFGTFVGHYILTLTQGVGLNLVLFVYLLIVYVFVSYTIGPPSPSNPKNFQKPKN